MTIMPRDEVQKLLDGTAKGPVYWAGLDCFRDLARSLLAAHDEIDRLRADADHAWAKAAEADTAAIRSAATTLEANADRDRLRADAQAAVALVVERADLAVQEVSDNCETDGERLAIMTAVDRLRSLAPADGLALVAELRAEIKRLTRCLKTANDNHEHFEREWYLAKDDRDRLAADNARLAALTDRLCAEADRLYLEGKQELPGPKLRAIANV